MTGPKLANLRQGFRGKPLAAEGLFALEPAPKFASKEFFPFISEINLCGCPNIVLPRFFSNPSPCLTSTTGLLSSS